MENKNNPTPADKLKKQGTCENQLNNNPGNTSTGGGQSGQYDKLNYGPTGCSTCKEDFDKNIDSLVGQVENHGSKEHRQQEHDVNAAFGRENIHATGTNTNIHTNKSFDSHTNSPKPSGGYPDTDKKGGKESGYGHDGKGGSYGQTDKNGVYGHPDKNTSYDRNIKNNPSGGWNKEQGGSTYGHNTQPETKHTPGKSEHPADYQKKSGKEIK